jgi:glycosyltransferase involved in cell wall biosynthesis
MFQYKRANMQPLCELLRKKVLGRIAESPQYKEIQGQIQEKIENTEEEQISFTIEPGALIFQEEENIINVSINPESPWHGILYLLRVSEALLLNLELSINPKDLPGNLRDVGEGVFSRYFPPIVEYQQVPFFESLAKNQKISAKLVVFLPREKSRFYITKGRFKSDSFMPDELPEKEIRIPIRLW